MQSMLKKQFYGFPNSLLFCSSNWDILILSLSWCGNLELMSEFNGTFADAIVVSRKKKLVETKSWNLFVNAHFWRYTTNRFLIFWNLHLAICRYSQSIVENCFCEANTSPPAFSYFLLKIIYGGFLVPVSVSLLRLIFT